MIHTTAVPLATTQQKTKHIATFNNTVPVLMRRLVTLESHRHTCVDTCTCAPSVAANMVCARCTMLISSADVAVVVICVLEMSTPLPKVHSLM